jgi:hypothetical protein
MRQSEKRCHARMENGKSLKISKWFLRILHYWPRFVNENPTFFCGQLPGGLLSVLQGVFRTLLWKDAGGSLKDSLQVHPADGRDGVKANILYPFAVLLTIRERPLAFRTAVAMVFRRFDGKLTLAIGDRILCRLQSFCS